MDSPGEGIYWSRNPQMSQTHISIEEILLNNSFGGVEMGMTEAEVIDLLGQPSSIGRDEESGFIDYFYGWYEVFFSNYFWGSVSVWFLIHQSVYFIHGNARNNMSLLREFGGELCG